MQGPGGLCKVSCCRAVKDLFLQLFCFQQTLEQREARINSQTDTKQRDRETAILRPVTRKMVSGWEDAPDGKAPKWMEPSVQSLSQVGVRCSVGWHSRGHWVGWLLSAQSQPLSLIMCASSMMYLPSLYFWLLSKACSYFHPRVVLQFSQ